MSFLSKLFNTPKVDCPRCLSKGEVDWNDIKRLNKELQWRPGKCAYCIGSGKVSSKMLSRVNVDNTYLTTDVSLEERNRLFGGDELAFQRATLYETQLDDFIMQIGYLHDTGNLQPYQIAEFYLMPESGSEVSPQERKELIDYIEKVIEKKKD